MKNLLLIISIILLSVNLSAANVNKLNQEPTNKAEISNQDNYKPITLRVYYLEVIKVTGENITYNEFLRDIQKHFFLNQKSVNVLSYEGYKIIKVSYNKIQAFKKL